MLLSIIFNILQVGHHAQTLDVDYESYSRNDYLSKND